MPRTLKVAVAGLGPVGQATVRAVLQTAGLKLVAVVDPATAYAGKNLGTVLGLPRKLRITIESRPERFLKKARADVVFVCTSSLLRDVKPQLVAPARRPHARDHDLRGAHLPGTRPYGGSARARSAGSEQEGLAARDRDQPRLRHGRPAARAHGTVCEGAPRVGDPGGGRGVAQPGAAEARRSGPEPRPVPQGRQRGGREARGARAIGAHDRRRLRLEARSRRRDARARDRAARPRHRVPAHRGGGLGGDPAVGPRVPRRRSGGEPRPAGLRRGRGAARPPADRRRSADRRDDRRRDQRRDGDGGPPGQLAAASARGADPGC